MKIKLRFKTSYKNVNGKIIDFDEFENVHEFCKKEILCFADRDKIELPFSDDEIIENAIYVYNNSKSCNQYIQARYLEVYDYTLQEFDMLDYLCKKIKLMIHMLSSDDIEKMVIKEDIERISKVLNKYNISYSDEIDGVAEIMIYDDDIDGYNVDITEKDFVASSECGYFDENHIKEIIEENEDFVGKLIVITYRLVFEKSDGYYPGENDEELIIIDMHIIRELNDSEYPK